MTGAFTAVAEVFKDGEPAYTLGASGVAVDSPAGCTGCGGNFQLYGPERLCWLCLPGSGNHGDPSLTSHFDQDEGN